MAAISWPAELPLTLRSDGLKSQYKDPVLRTDMDMGPAKTRLRYTRPPKTYGGTIAINEDGRKLLDYFYRITTRFGALRFNFTNPQSLEVREYRFTSPPEETGSDGIYTITLQLEEL
jgi:hypothetical protein